MKEYILKFPIFYRLYQNLVREKNHEYFFFQYLFKKIKKDKIRVLDLCCGDSYILDYCNKYLEDYMGYDNNSFYLNQNKKRWKKFKFIFGDLKDLTKNKDIFKFNPNLIFMNGAIHHLNKDLVLMVNRLIKSKFKNAIFISVDPVKDKNKMINKIMIHYDRGKFIRSNFGYKKLMKNYSNFIIDDFYKMSFQNIFHFRNIKLKDLYFEWKRSLNH